MPVYRRLKAVAVNRGLRGFSPIVEDALTEYFQAESRRKQIVEAVAGAEGAWSDEDVAAWEGDVTDAWATWRLSPS